MKRISQDLNGICAVYRIGVSINSIEQVIRNGNLYHKQYKITKVCRSHK